MKKNFDTDILFTNVVTHFQLLSATFIKYGQNINKDDISEVKQFGEKWVRLM